MDWKKKLNVLFQKKCCILCEFVYNRIKQLNIRLIIKTGKGDVEHEKNL